MYGTEYPNTVIFLKNVICMKTSEDIFSAAIVLLKCGHVFYTKKRYRFDWYAYIIQSILLPPVYVTLHEYILFLFFINLNSAVAVYSSIWGDFNMAIIVAVSNIFIQILYLWSRWCTNCLFFWHIQYTLRRRFTWSCDKKMTFADQYPFWNIVCGNGASCSRVNVFVVLWDDVASSNITTAETLYLATHDGCCVADRRLTKKVWI